MKIKKIIRKMEYKKVRVIIKKGLILKAKELREYLKLWKCHCISLEIQNSLETFTWAHLIRREPQLSSILDLPG